MESTFTSIVLPIVTAFLGAGGMAFLQFLITRRDSRNERIQNKKDEISKKLDSIMERLDKEELALTRLQLLNLIQHDGSQHECMMVAERYFKDLEGDWYMTPIFCRWLKDHGLEKPVWFSGKD